ncbi:MAG: hypothetical protein IJJ01_13015 [Firmicutes bacterium]|nr:hypothetical protein [Bacillota bacterium]
MKSEIITTEANRVQHIYDQFKARSSKDDEFKDWAGYRERLTEFVISCIPSGASLLILGAGKCNDLDLKKLAQHCGTITLSDYQPETAEEAFHQYGLSPSENLKFAASDYVGITDEDYLAYTDLLLKTMEKLRSDQEPQINVQNQGDVLEKNAGPELSALRECLEQIYKSNENYEIDLGDKDYDYAVVTGVHSQLNNSFRGLFQYIRKDIEDRGGEIRFLDNLNTAIFQTTRKHTKDLVTRFNDAIFDAVREGLIYGYEKNIIYTPAGAKEPVIGTVDGARQAGEAIADFPAEKSLDCIWPLSRRRGIKFTMSIHFVLL